MASPGCSARLKTVQRTSLTLAFLIGMVSYMDRTTLSVANPLIRKDLGLSIADMGLLLSAFLWPYAFALLAAGGVVDRFLPRRVLAAALLLWSAAQVLAGFVSSFGEFVVARVLLGIGEAPTFPCFARVVRGWYRARDQALSVGIWNASPSFGIAVSAPVLTVIMLALGWRWMFVVMGIVGVVLAVVWFLVFRDVSEVALADDEKSHLLDGEEAMEPRQVNFAEWRRLFGFRATWGLILGFFGNVYIGWLFISWLPGYLEMQRHMSIPKTGLVASVPFLCGVVGSIAGGWFADKLMSKGFSAINSRKIPTIISLVVMAAGTLVAAETPSNFIAVGAISVAVFFGFASSGTSWALATACAPTHCAASLGAIMDFGGFIGGALAPMVTGFVVQATGSFVPALLTASMIGLLSAVAYLVAIPGRPIHKSELRGVAASPPMALG